MVSVDLACVKLSLRIAGRHLWEKVMDVLDNFDIQRLGEPFAFQFLCEVVLCGVFPGEKAREKYLAIAYKKIKEILGVSHNEKIDFREVQILYIAVMLEKSMDDVRHHFETLRKKETPI